MKQALPRPSRTLQAAFALACLACGPHASAVDPVLGTTAACGCAAAPAAGPVPRARTAPPPAAPKSPPPLRAASTAASASASAANVTQVVAVTCPAVDDDSPARTSATKPQGDCAAACAAAQRKQESSGAGMLVLVRETAAAMLALVLAVYLAIKGTSMIGQALDGLPGEKTQGPGEPRRVGIRKHWGSFGQENSGWLVSPCLLQLAAGGLLAALAVFLIVHVMDGLDGSSPKAGTDVKPAAPAAATAPATAPATSPLPAGIPQQASWP